MMLGNRYKIIVLQVGPRSYIQADYSSYVRQRAPRDKPDLSAFLINGKPADARPAPGDPSYYQINGKVRSIQLIRNPVRVVTRYIANKEFPEARSPISVEEYQAIDSERRELIYSPEYRMDQLPPIDCPFEVHEVDAAPVQWPAGVMVRRPEYLGMFKSQWHTLPCFITSTALHTRLATAVKAAIDQQKLINVTYYENIGHLRVDASFTVMGKSISAPIVHFDAKTDRASDKPLPAIEGANLADLEAKIKAFIDGEVKKITDIQAPTTCPCCEQKLPKGKRIYFPTPSRHY